MQKTHQDSFRIRHGEVDRNAKLRLDSYFEYMQDTAAAHADILGVGFRELMAKNMIWVLSRLKLQVLRTPSAGEQITLKTWPGGMEKLFAAREFEFHSETNDDIFAKATSYWLMVDLEKYRPVRHTEFLQERLPDNSDLPKYFTGLEKLSVPETMDFPLETIVRESMIDSNQHLNNARCSAIVYDWLAAASGNVPEIEEIQINFAASTPVGTLLNTVGTLKDGVFSVETSGQNPEGKNILRFQAHGKIRC